MSKKQTILHMDDTLDTRALVRQTLEKEDYTVITLPSPQMGIEFLENNDINLVICDINMPYENGFEFLREVRRNPKFNKIPFVFLTNVSSDIAVEQARELGADMYLFKYETTPEKLKKSVEQALKIKRKS